MPDSPCDDELLQLPDEIYRARCAVLQAEQELMTAAAQHEQLRIRHYLTASTTGSGHYAASATAASMPDVISAREYRDQVESAYKHASALHTRLRDRLKVLLRLSEHGHAEQDSAHPCSLSGT